MSRYGRLRIYAVLCGLGLLAINGTAIAFTGFDWWNAPFILLGLVVLVVGGDLAGKGR
mgnify:CR=1 FL=1